MKKIWSYIALFFVGLSAGLLVAVRTAGDDYSAYIKRIKQRGKEGATQTVDFKPVLNSDDQTLSDRKTKRKERREKRLLDKLNKK